MIFYRIRRVLANSNRVFIRVTAGILFFVALHYPFTSSPETFGLDSTYDSKSVINTIVPINAVSWSTLDLITWQLGVDDSHLLRKKQAFIEGYANVITAAANENGIPPELLAGIAWREFGGDPMWIDDVAYWLRECDHTADSFSESLSITRDPNETSFGNVSVQVRRGAEVLGYDPETLTHEETNAVIAALKDPVQNIFIAANHLAYLLKIDFSDKPISELTQDDLEIVATRFNRGPELTRAQIQADTRYGANVLKRYNLGKHVLYELRFGSLYVRDSKCERCSFTGL